MFRISMNQAEAAKKIQKMFRRKRVSQETGLRFSKTTITNYLCKFGVHVNFLNGILGLNVKGFTSVVGYFNLRKLPIVRYANGEWMGLDRSSSVKYIVAKIKNLTVKLQPDHIEISGSGNYEEALRYCIKNKWIPVSASRLKPEFKIINTKFTVNTGIALENLAEEVNQEVPELLDEPAVYDYNPELGSTFPSLKLKFKRPKLTFQVFQSGTVLCSGIKNLEDLEVPRELFKQLFTSRGVSKTVFNMKKGSTGGSKLAARNPSAGTWDKLVSPVPAGYYIRPGTDGQPRLYVYQYFIQLEEGPAIFDPKGKVDLSGVAPKVVKAFAEVGQPIPASTLKVFREAGHPLEAITVAEEPRTAMKNRRAPGWNAEKPGFYVRPGPGQQPYWFKIPKIKSSGKKTVLSTYTKAGRNIPAAVRKIFGISENVKVNASERKHLIRMGINNILRINNRQATRLTKAELVAIARNLEIPEASETLKPTQLMQLIQSKAGVSGAIRKFNANINGTKYRLREDRKIEKTQGNKQTVIEWKHIPAADKVKIGRAILAKENWAGFNSMPNSFNGENLNKFNGLWLVLQGRRAARKASPSPNRKASPAPAPAPGVNYTPVLRKVLGNYFKNEDVPELNKKIKLLPVGPRGKPLKPDIVSLIKNYAKTAIIKRRQEIIKANYETKIVVPNWVPANRKANFKKRLLELATTPNNKGKYPIPKRLKEAMNAWINRNLNLSSRGAYEYEDLNTGQIIKVPARSAIERGAVKIPKRISPNHGPKKSPKPKKEPENQIIYYVYKVPLISETENLGSAMINAGLNIRNGHTWKEVVRAGVNKKFKNVWMTHVAKSNGGPVGPIKRR